MSRTEHTPGPWSQGRLLLTRITRRWSMPVREAEDKRERRMVFANFTGTDEGRSRALIAVCEREEDAALIAAAPELLEEGEFLLARLDELERELGLDEAGRHFEGHVAPSITRLRQIINKAKGGAA